MLQRSKGHKGCHSTRINQIGRISAPGSRGTGSASQASAGILRTVCRHEHAAHIERFRLNRRVRYILVMANEPDGDCKRTVRLPLLLTEDEAEKLDDWRFANRMRTRSDAIRWLIELGLETAKGAPEKQP